MRFNSLKTKRNIYLSVKKHLEPHKKKVFFIIIMRVIQLFLGVITTFLFKILVDDIMINKNIQYLKWVCMGYLLLFTFESMLIILIRILHLSTYNKIFYRLRLSLWNRYYKMPYEKYEKYDVGDLKNRIDTDTDTFELFVSRQLIDCFFAWCNIVVNSVILFTINWILAFFSFIMIPVSFWITTILSEKTKKVSEEYRSHWGKYEGFINSTIHSWKEVKLLVIESKAVEIFTGFLNTLSKLFFRRTMINFANSTIHAFKDFFVVKMNLYFLGGLLIFRGSFSIGMLIVFIRYYETLFNSIQEVNALIIDLKNDEPSIFRVTEALKFEKEENINSKKGFTFENELRISGISFKYPQGDNNIFNNLNLTIYPHDYIAIVGESGSGKTTLAKLLLGLYAPQYGNIYLDNIPINAINKYSYQRDISAVLQESILFNVSIKDNLLLSKNNATNKEIEESCILANIHDDIMNFPNGYETIIGENAVRLSGGQKQRLVIARATLIDSKIIIFDEATSSVDSSSECKILDSIKNLADKKTVIIIAHRLSTVANAKRIIVMEQGEIVGDDTIEQLYSGNKVFNRLFSKK